MRITTLLPALLAAVLLVLTPGMVSAEPARPGQILQNEEPAVAPDSAQAGSITQFRAVPSRTRGRIDVSWKYSGKGFNGSFVVERSTNGGAWRTLGACTQSVAGKGSYSCSDTGLTSGTAYAYRACVAARDAACSAGTITKTVVVKAP